VIDGCGMVGGSEGLLNGRIVGWYALASFCGRWFDGLMDSMVGWFGL